MNDTMFWMDIRNWSYVQMKKLKSYDPTKIVFSNSLVPIVNLFGAYLADLTLFYVFGQFSMCFSTQLKNESAPIVHRSIKKIKLFHHQGTIANR